MPNVNINRRVLMSGAPFQYSAAARNFFSVLPTQPSPSIKVLYNNMFISMSDILAISDTFYVNWGEYEDNQRVNLASPGTYTKTVQAGSPTFTKYVGIKGGSGAAYNWNYNPAVNAVHFGLNDCCLWIWLQPDRVLTISDILGCANANQHGSIRLFPYNFPPKTVYGTTDPFKNGSAQAAYTDDEIQELWSFTWDGSNFKLYHNGVLKETVAGATVPQTINFDFTELAQNLAGTLSASYTSHIGAIGICKSTVNQLDLYNGLKAFNDALPVWSFYGDSLTSGYLLSNPTTECWPYKLAVGRGFSAFNNGVPNATIASFVSSGIPYRKYGNPNQRIFLSWSLNDSVAYSVATLQTKISEQIARCVAAGWPLSKIVYITGYPADPLGNAGFNVTNYLLYVAGAEATCISEGVQHFNLYSALPGVTIANGKLQPDGYHQTDSGTTDSANYLIANVL